MKYYILYNSLAGVGNARRIAEDMSIGFDNSELLDLKKISNYEEFFSELGLNDIVIVCGGDGTLNRFINDTNHIEKYNKIFYYPTGTGNDFAYDVGQKSKNQPFLINDYIVDLPSVEINGNSFCFINGVGFGIDGYCCEIVEIKKQKRKASAKKVKPISYTRIVIKGLIYDYKPRKAIVTVDGETYTYNKVWAASTMKGRFFGGGVMIAPNQNRHNDSNNLSLVVIHDVSRLKALQIFPLLYSGGHVKHTAYVTVLEGQDITVEFIDEPCSLQLDGETFSGIKSYHATSRVLCNKN